MDSPTHILLGATTAQLWPRSRIGRDATWVLAAAAVLPDLDSLAVPLMTLTGSETDDLTRLIVHRGISHSLLAVPVIALPVAALWWWARRRIGGRRRGLARPAAKPFWLLYAAVFMAVMVHPLLDWCTSYGTQLFAPISNARLSFDAIAIIDIFFTPLLVLTLGGCWAVRKLAPRRRTLPLVVGWVGFALAVGYIAAGRVAHDMAVRRAVAAAGETPVIRAEAYPVIGSIFLWRGVVRTPEGWEVSRQHLLGPPGQPRHADQAENVWVARARQVEEARVWEWFTQGQVRTVYDHRDGWHVVELHDMRYGLVTDATESLWALRVTFDQDDPDRPQVQRVSNFRDGTFRRMIRRLWADLWRW